MSGSQSNLSDRPDAVDASCRLPVLYLLAGGLAWLFAGLGLALVAAVKLKWPGFLSQCEVLTYGRLEAASRTALVFGFASQMGLGLAFWILARTGNTRLPVSGIAFVIATVWNAGLTVGIGYLLLQGSSGVTWLEIPRQISPVILAATGLLSLVGIAAFAARDGSRSEPAQWHLLGALIAFPLLYLTAQLALLFFPVRGIAQSVTHGWFSQGLFLLWLAPLALAVLYHFIPVVSERPTASARFAPLAFWTWWILAGWTGAAEWIGGPVPAWWVTVSIAAGVLLLIPIVLTLLNLQGACLFSRSVVLRFAAVSIISFALWGVLTAVTSLRCAQSVLHFTQFGVGLKELFLFGFVAPALFAGVYSVVPRLAGREFPCRISPQAHWIFTTGGIAVMTLAFLVGGWIQGWQLASPEIPFGVVSARLHPWLLVHAFGLALFGFGQMALAANAAWLLFECVKPLKDPVIALFSTTASPVVGK